jgi:hypothetical protein
LNHCGNLPSPFSEAVRLKIDLGAENAIAAQRGQEKIAVEIKSFNNTAK